MRPLETAVLAAALLSCACRTSSASSVAPGTFPLVKVSDTALPGAANRFDYQDLDVARARLVIAHMNDASVVIVRAADGSVEKVLPNIPTARGVVVAPEVGRIFVTSSPNQLVIIDRDTLVEIGRVTAGAGPDGVGWDPVHGIVATSDQHDGAVSLIVDAGSGERTQIALGKETGNVVFDASRDLFWVTVVGDAPPDQLVAIDPISKAATQRLSLPGCGGAHGLRIHPDHHSALVACEDNSLLARVDLTTGALTTTPVGQGADVLALDEGLGWLYVAAESGDLTVVDLTQAGLVVIDREHVADHAHTVAVDAATHHVFFPLESGPAGTPVLRTLRPGP